MPKYRDCTVHMHRPDSAGGDRTVRVRVTETEIRAYGGKDPRDAMERIARARAARKLYGMGAFFNYEAQYPHRGQIFRSRRAGCNPGTADACTPVITLRVEET
jgi:hypothetical protein